MPTAKTPGHEFLRVFYATHGDHKKRHEVPDVKIHILSSNAHVAVRQRRSGCTENLPAAVFVSALTGMLEYLPYGKQSHRKHSLTFPSQILLRLTPLFHAVLRDKKYISLP